MHVEKKGQKLKSRVLDERRIVSNGNEVSLTSPAYEQAWKGRKEIGAHVRARMNTGRLSKMATGPAGLDASRIHVVRRIAESRVVGGGFTAAQSTGGFPPLGPWRRDLGWNTSLSPIRPLRFCL